MFGQCDGPVWGPDDFSSCFRNDYLQALFPLIASGLSLSFLSYKAAHRLNLSRLKKARLNGYERLQNGHVNGAYSNTREPDDTDSEDDHLTLRRTKSAGHESVVEVDRPRGQTAIVIVEVIAVLGELAISLTALLTHAWGSNGLLVALAGLVSWAYIFILVSTRLILSASTLISSLKLWNHTATLYALQWLFTAAIFRSALIHPVSRLTQTLTIINFSLASLLLIIVASIRRGNKEIALEYEDGVEPSKEPLASLFSILTFSWVDAIVWQGYKTQYKIEHVWNLIPEEKAVAVLRRYHQLNKTTRLSWHLLKHFRRSLSVQALWAGVSACSVFIPTILMNRILRYIEDPKNTPKNAVWLYVMLMFVVGCCNAVCDGQALWIGRKICIELRAIVVGEIYAKALRRKAAAGSDTVLGDQKDQVPKQSLAKRIMSFGRTKQAPIKQAPGTKPTPTKEEQSDSQVNNGTIITLMSTDAFKVAEISAYLHFMWSSVPIQLVICITLLFNFLGYAAIAGLITMAFLLPLNIVMAKGFSKLQKKVMAGTDARVHSTNEVLQNIRIIKFFAWEHRFNDMVNAKRKVELRALRNRFLLWAFAVMVWYSAPTAITFLSFFIFTVIEKKDLTPSVAFTALSLFSILRVPLDQFADMLSHIQDALVSVERVEEFLGEEETEKYEQLQAGKEANPDQIIGFDKVTCIWGGREDAAGAESSAFKLIDIDVKFLTGHLNIVAGPTGSGKTSLLMALLGEMTLLKGKVYLPGGYNREELPVDPETGLTESVAYCAQQAWLTNNTVKQNILFASPFDQKRYQAVIDACSLKRDLEILDAGDETLVGEKGISLSGGQKQRISLARALYSNSRHVLLDDCLSAVDSHTAKWIFEKCIMGPLMYHRTCILVTHNIALTVANSQYVVVMDNGRVAAQGSPDDVMKSGALGDDIQQSAPGSKGGSQMHSRVASNLENGTIEGTNESAAQANGSSNEAKSKKDVTKFEDAYSETMATGRVKIEVIKFYLKSMGPWYYWVITVAIFALQQVGAIATNVWIREWANSYQTKNLNALSRSRHISHVTSMRGFGSTYSSSCLKSGSCGWGLPLFPSGNITSSSSVIAQSEGVNVAYYLGVYALIGVGYGLISFVRELTLFGGSLSASWKIHRSLLLSVTRARFRFFDSTPIGQLMNRFSKDMEALDQEIAAVAMGAIQCFASVVTVLILISVITPKFLIAAFTIAVIYFFVGKLYLSSSTDLKRLESNQRSPLFQHFGETLSGVTTIRAYGDEQRFIRDNLNRINTQSRPFIALWATNRWLGLRVEFIGALVAFSASLFVVLNIGKIDAGAAGLSLSYAVMFSESMLWLVRLYAMNEQNMNSVERIKEFINVDQEADAIAPDNRPGPNWPSKGAIQFINYSTRYRSDLDPVLRNVSFTVPSMEKVGIVGRTGAGKSSLAMALFRGLEADEGKILIDEVDIGLIGLQDLREAVTIVPQDPTLFTGTIRSNLDPFDMFTDEEVFTALRRVQLIDSTKLSTAVDPPANGTTTSATVNKNIFLDLSSSVTESGNNLSQGQKQLLCLARALLKDPKVIMMDEATASIDYATDTKIQRTIRELNGTIITIAHRLQTIIDYDKVLVLDAGKVVEYDHPWVLLRDKEGMFRGMCETSGEFEALEANAKKAWKAKQLVDLD